MSNLTSMTLREAAERTSRSVTTLRRYIRSGRLHAEKRYGRFGPEYFVSEQDLDEAGLELRVPGETPEPAAPTETALAAPAQKSLEITEYLQDAVPRGLYETLQMKHEQLLVQYGMVRAGGLRYMELSAEVDSLRTQVENAAEERRRLGEKTLEKDAELRRARLELESVQVELDAAKEKLKALEMLTRNSATSASIEQQFSSVMEQSQRVRELQNPGERPAEGPSARDPQRPDREDITTRMRPRPPGAASDH